MALLPWSKDRDSVDRLTLGNMAKYTLVNNAARDTKLLDDAEIRGRRTNPRPTRPEIKEVVDAAETVDTRARA